jgi:ZIP family zinc transporter
MISIWLQSGLWGFVAGAALLIGPVLAYFVQVPQRLIPAITAFGNAASISALSFELMDEACRRGDFDSTAIGFLSALPFTRRLTDFYLIGVPAP